MPNLLGNSIASLPPPPFVYDTLYIISDQDNWRFTRNRSITIFSARNSVPTELSVYG